MTLPDFPERDSRASESSNAARALQFERTLVPRLIAAHHALNARFGNLIGLIEHDPTASIAEVEECSRLFAAVRHIETSGLYTLLAQIVKGDAAARGELMELRLIALMLARRLQRCFDELVQALRAEVLGADAASRVSVALANYARHAEHAVYPLYELIGTHRQDAGENRVA